MNIKRTKTSIPFLSRYVRSMFYVLCSMFFPLISFATPSITVFRTPSTALNFTTFANKLSDIANVIIPFLIGLSLVAIIWGIFKYIRNAGDTEKVAEGKKVIVYGIVAMFLMLSFWGFVMMVKTSLFGTI